MDCVIRPATADDFEAIWAIFQSVVEPGDAFAYTPETTGAETRSLWMGPTNHAWVAMVGGTVAGTYFVRPNQPGRGSHVANAGYMVSPAFRGKGIGRAMALDSLGRAKHLGYEAMQFNFVVSTNEQAVRLWKDIGFDVVGTLPGAFRHATLGDVDVYVMHRRLD